MTEGALAAGLGKGSATGGVYNCQALAEILDHRQTANAANDYDIATLKMNHRMFGKHATLPMRKSQQSPQIDSKHT